MEDIRDSLKKLLLDNLCIQFKDHDALRTANSFNATVKLVDYKVDVVVEEIIKLFKCDQSN